jgi:hypothetical protein
MEEKEAAINQGKINIMQKVKIFQDVLLFKEKIKDHQVAEE